MRLIFSLAWWISAAAAQDGSAEEAIADILANGDLVSATDAMNSVTKEDLSQIPKCSSFKDAGSCDPTRNRGRCINCVDRDFVRQTLHERSDFNIVLGKAKCPSKKSFPPKLREYFTWVMAPQRFENTRVCFVERESPPIHDLLHAESKSQAVDDALASSGSVDRTAASLNSGTLLTKSDSTNTTNSTDKHILGLDRNILMIAAGAGAFVVLLGLVVCISQR